MKSTYEVAEALLKNMGLSTKGQNLTGFTIKAEAGEPVTVTLNRVQLDLPEPTYTFETREIVNCTPVDPSAKIDAMCAAAHKALAQSIDTATRAAGRAIGRGFIDAHLNCGLPLRPRHYKFMTMAERDMFFEFQLITEREPWLLFKRPELAYRFASGVTV